MKKNQIPYKMILPESEMPKFWYNIQADMKELPAPYLNPMTKKEITADDLAPIFASGLIEQELSTERYIEIPKDVLEKYHLARPTSLHRAYNLEKALDTPARIYYKYEGANPSGSHKLNSAIPQAYYNMLDGKKRVSTETGAGQWGTAISIASQFYGLECTVYMVKVSYEQKPYRKSIMHTYGASVIPSPSNLTQCGRDILAKHPDSLGSLGIAISEAVEDAVLHDDTNYTLGSVLNHVALHQTIIGEECKKQMEMIDEYPDIIIGCNGGGSNFSGISYPFMMDKLQGKTKTRFIAVEAAACPKLTKGKYAYDYGDTAMKTPITMMYTLGHDFMPSGIHAGGLRYHGDSPLLSKLYHDGYVEAAAVNQTEVFDAAVLFAKNEAILPAPESSHAICQAIKEALKCKESGEEKVILFNLSGNGYLDLYAYDQYLAGNLEDEIPGIGEELDRSLGELPEIQ
ncbi:TrpB-like pyridoxal phosphate-dependent enzyme [Candidatus Soleaferrea massiliensis]|uniref:TrpB-like pyridoxal phosphate-dependent enzyme n=1 Tax=Candidatus Soleaferrea massiliensis TaxID=1470354 RepID=UPI00058C823D|nr:TrpB-like pyridoxal phosphate-dependent enzyme [Candidatus Soleaferrea massiliensis]